MQLIFSDYSQGGKATELDRLRDRARHFSNSSTSDLWRHILEAVFRGSQWRIVTRNLAGAEYDDSIEICVYRSGQNGPFLVWRGQQPVHACEDQADVEGDLEEQTHRAAGLHLVGSGRDAIWVMTSLGPSAKLFVLRAGRLDELMPVWPYEARKDLSCLRDPQDPNRMPYRGPASRNVEEEEMMHGAVSSEGLELILEDASSYRRAVRALRAGREMFGPENTAGYSQIWKQEYRFSRGGSYSLVDGDDLPDRYNDIKEFSEDYEAILAHIKLNPTPRFYSHLHTR